MFISDFLILVLTKKSNSKKKVDVFLKFYQYTVIRTLFKLGLPLKSKKKMYH